MRVFKYYTIKYLLETEDDYLQYMLYHAFYRHYVNDDLDMTLSENEIENLIYSFYYQWQSDTLIEINFSRDRADIVDNSDHPIYAQMAALKEKRDYARLTRTKKTTTKTAPRRL